MSSREFDDPAAAVDALAGEHGHDVDDARAWLLARPEAALRALQAAVADGRAGPGVATVLGALDDPRAVPALAVTLDRGGAVLRWAAAQALGATSGNAALGVLVAAAAHPDPDRRREAAWALGQRPEPGAAAVLAGLAADPDPVVRDAAVRAAVSR